MGFRGRGGGDGGAGGGAERTTILGAAGRMGTTLEGTGGLKSRAGIQEKRVAAGDGEAGGGGERVTAGRQRRVMGESEEARASGEAGIGAGSGEGSGEGSGDGSGDDGSGDGSEEATGDITGRSRARGDSLGDPSEEVKNEDGTGEMSRRHAGCRCGGVQTTGASEPYWPSSHVSTAAVKRGDDEEEVEEKREAMGDVSGTPRARVDPLDDPRMDEKRELGAGDM